jgi:DNA-binding IclR family transcriptional regulator
MSYDLRRLRLHGLIERLEKSHRYQLTAFGLKIALFYSRTYSRVLRPGLSLLSSPITDASPKITRAFNQFDRAVAEYLAEKKVA